MENNNKQFSIKIMGKDFQSNEDGLLNLNIIAKSFNLKSPSQWRTKERRALEADAKLHSLKNPNQGKGQASHFMMADEDATIFYGMHIDYSFGLAVVQAFRELRNAEVESALNLAANSMSQSDGDKLKEMVWENINGMKVINQRTALQVAGIKHPIIFMRELRKRTKAYKRLQDEGKIVYQTYDQGKWTDRFTQEGFQWLLDKAETMNCWVEEIKVSNKKLSKSLQG